MKSVKKVLSLFLSFLLLLSTPLHVLAEGGTAEDDPEGVEEVNTGCAECGAAEGHLATCSQYEAPAPAGCAECGAEEGHLATCSQYEAPAPAGCAECGAEEGHLETCSQYEAPAPAGCAECGAAEGHLATCSQYEAPAPAGCAECGAEEGHLATCSQYEAPAPAGCAECGAEEGHLETCSQYEAPVETCAHCGVELTDGAVHLDTCLTHCTCEPVEGVHREGCRFYVEPTAAERMIAQESMEDLWSVMSDYMNNDPEALMAMTLEEVQAVYARVLELDPAQEYEFYQDVVDTLQYIAGEFDLNGAQTLVTTTSGTWQGARFKEDSVQELGDNATITMRMLTDEELTIRQQNANFVIPSGVTVTFKGYGTFARAADNPMCLIYVEEGGTAIIEGTSEEQPLIIDGKGVIANAPLIYCDGTLIIKNAIIQNGKNRFVNEKGAPYGLGGGIRIANIKGTGSLTIENSKIRNNTASLNGGGIWCNAPMTVTDSEITNNVAGSAETYDIETGLGKVNAGRGGGFEFHGKDAEGNPLEGVFTNVLVANNVAGYYGGGGQVASGASLTMNGTTKFYKNEVVLDGAGALHVTGDAIFTMNGGSMEENYAPYCGGAIHSSYGCTLNLNSGSFLNNSTHGRGGAIHINTGGAITLGEGIKICGNKAYKKKKPTSFTMDEAGDTWVRGPFNGSDENYGYGGGIMIDSGTCTVQGAMINDNHAVVGGGGIALTMLNAIKSGLPFLLCVNFTMHSGEVNGNTTDGDGAGVYLMSNNTEDNLRKEFKTQEAYDEAIAELEKRGEGFAAELLASVPNATVTGGTIEGNDAADNGGALFLDRNTKFIISGGSISANKAANGAGVYVASGSAYIEGGSIDGNAAQNAGGGIFVSGSVDMLGGSIENNTAVNGGGAYLTGGSFTMISGSVKNNAAKEIEAGAAEAGTEGYGGGVFVHNGNITIGVKDCEGTGENHTTGEHTDKTHPDVTNNDAVFGGGLAVDGGTVDIYCGTIISNEAMNDGTGKNIFMYDSSGEDKGTINHYGGTIGQSNNHGMVVIGGQLNVNTDGQEITIKYHSNEEGYITLWIGKAPKDYYLNLPYCPHEWEVSQNDKGYTFGGWTYDPDALDEPGTVIDLDHIRDKNDYKALGEPVQIKEITGNKDANGLYVDFYAVWAPKNNAVTYDIDFDNYGTAADVFGQPMTEEQKADNTAGYVFSYLQNATITMTVPSIPGYTFLGWRVTPSEEKRSNWSIKEDNEGTNDEAVEYLLANTTSGKAVLADYGYAYSADGSVFTLSTDRNFGDLKLTALFEEQTAEYNFILVGPENASNFGTMTARGASEAYTTATENQKYTVTVGKATGDPGTAAAKAEYGFKLKDPKGWFTDEAGADAVDPAWVNEGILTPHKVDGLYAGGTFYAVIEYHLADLIISKTAEGFFSGDQTFIFEVYQGDDLLTTVALQTGGSVTVKDLIIGTEYTVKEVGGWSWRFDAKDQAHTMVPVAEGAENTNIVMFENTQLRDLWLTDDASVLNMREGN